LSLCRVKRNAWLGFECLLLKRIGDACPNAWNKGGYWEMRVVLMSSMEVGDCHG